MTGAGFGGWAGPAIAAVATAGVVLRPFGWPEYVWAVLGAALLAGLGLLSLHAAWAAIAQGSDIYLFLTGMMLLAEIARGQGLFDWLATRAACLARGSGMRLFVLIYGVAIGVTVLLSNDATAVVLTPAVAAVVKAASARAKLPYLLICAFVANAASFVLPISNPANLVIYASHLPPLLLWLPRYFLPSLLSIAATFAVLLTTQFAALRAPLAAEPDQAPLGTGGVIAGTFILVMAIALLTASGLGLRLGLPAAALGLATLAAVWLGAGASPLRVVRDVSWGVLPLVAGLFVLVAEVQQTAAMDRLVQWLGGLVCHGAAEAAWISGGVVALGCNLVNNLPAGLLAGRVAMLAHAPEPVRAAVLIGVDLGPNLSVTGSLATILWLSALRREGLSVGAWQFFKLGALVMPPALLLALAAVR